MSITRCRHLAVLMVCGCLAAFLPLQGSSVDPAAPHRRRPTFSRRSIRRSFASATPRAMCASRAANGEPLGRAP